MNEAVVDRILFPKENVCAFSFFISLLPISKKMKSIKSILVILAISIASSSVAVANPVEKSELVRLGKLAFSQRTDAPYNEQSTLKEVHYLGEDSENPLLAVLNFDEGFLVMSGDDAAVPVLAYATSGNLNMDELPPAVQYWLDGYQQEIREMRDNGITASEYVSQAWSNLSAKQNRAEVVSPLVTAKWNQTKYYNQYSPIDSDSPSGYDNRTPNGCVAVAMAMVMYYYRYPVQGSGSHTNHSSYGDFTVNFAQQTYNYEAMQDELSYYNNEVAKLIYHCATSVDMMYAPSGSGAYSQDVPYAVKQYFNYSTDCALKRLNNYNLSTWKQMVRNELDLGRPLYYSGYSDEGGHAFVCDGYDDDQKFHFNFGWGGSGNGFYVLSASDSSSNPVGGYVNSQGAIFDFYPGSNYPAYCDSKIISSSSGTLEDGSNAQDYLNNTNCTYVITDDQAYRVYIEIQSFDTESGHDSLTFWDGNPQNGLPLLTLSGSMPQVTSYTFNTDSLYITFISDSDVTGSGWRLTYEVDRDVTTCNIEVINNSQYYGTISDGSGASNYGNNLNCMWKIRVSDKEWIKFTFTEFDVSPEDEVRFYSLKTLPKVLLASYSGSDIPDPVIFESNYIEVDFITDNYLNEEGFSIFWTTDTLSTYSSSLSDLSNDSMVVFPNPANEVLRVQLPYDNNWNVQVMDFSGRLMYSESFVNSDNFVLSLSNLSAGMYVLVCRGNDKVLKKKFIISR